MQLYLFLELEKYVIQQLRGSRSIRVGSCTQRPQVPLFYNVTAASPSPHDRAQSFSFHVRNRVALVTSPSTPRACQRRPPEAALRVPARCHRQFSLGPPSLPLSHLPAPLSPPPSLSLTCLPLPPSLPFTCLRLPPSLSLLALLSLPFLCKPFVSPSLCLPAFPSFPPPFLPSPALSPSVPSGARAVRHYRPDAR